MDEQQVVETWVAEEATREFLGQWHRLVSTTNWEKGRIILEWRQSLITAGAVAHEFSDDAWSRRVASVSSQHVGRLRRVYERFGAVRNDFRGLYWSHFAAGVEWPDAEMWLEGAVQSGWSVSQMRLQRWEVLGKPADEAPGSEDPALELDEDATPAESAAPQIPAGKEHLVRDVAGGPDYSQGPDFGDADGDRSAEGVPFDISGSRVENQGAEQTIRPFEHLAALPDDLAEAFEQFKLAIVRHRLSNWSEVPRDDVLASLDALRRLCLAPSDAN